MSPAIELHNISKTFPERNWKSLLFRKPRYTKALDNVSLTVKKGEIMGLLGPNGAGKTTLIKILATLISPDTGEGQIAGFSLTEQTSAIKNKIGLVNTNDRTFYWRLSGWDNLDFFATLYNLTGTSKTKRIRDVLALTEMEDKAGYRFMAYSAGQKQRLSIARALLAKPEILLLDEATTNLDPIATRRLLDFTRKILIQKEKTTIIWCTHNLHEAQEICDKLAIMHEGKIIEHVIRNSMRDLLNIKNTYSCTVNKYNPVILAQEEFIQISSESENQQICHFSIAPNEVPPLVENLIRDGIEIYQLSPVENQLETLFRKLITEQKPREEGF